MLVNVSIVDLTLAQSKSPLSTEGILFKLPAVTTPVIIANRVSTVDLTSAQELDEVLAIFPPLPPATAGPTESDRFLTVS